MAPRAQRGHARGRPLRRGAAGELSAAILDVAAALVVVLDREGRIVAFNHACERVTGWSFEEVRGMPFFDRFLLPGEAAAVRRTFADLVAGLFPNTHENHWRTRGGGVRLVSWSNTALLDAAGRVEHVVATGLDVTEARRAEERLRALADASRAFSSGLDYRSVLDAVVRRLGELVGDGCLIRVVSEDGAWLEPVAFFHRDARRDALIRAVQRTSPQRAVEGLTGRVLRTGQTLRIPALTRQTVRAEMKPEYWPYLAEVSSLLIAPLSVRGRAFGHLTLHRDLGGPPYSAEDQSFVEDLASRAAEAIDNARLYGMARAAVAARDEFLSIASHELRTPLTALKLAVQNLRRVHAGAAAASPGAMRRTLETAERQAARLEKLVSALLDVSRVQAGRLDLTLEDVDLGAVVSEVLAHLDEELAEAACPVTSRVRGPVRGRWDRFRVGQVVTNLVSNALKYGAGKPIEIELQGDGERVRLSVRDHGVGISEHDQALLFQRFARAGASRNFGGLGLGLYIVRRLAEAHGGRVRVESAPDEGAVFTVELPASGPPGHRPPPAGRDHPAP